MNHIERLRKLAEFDEDAAKQVAFDYTKKKAFTFHPEIKKQIDLVFLEGERAENARIIKLVTALCDALVEANTALNHYEMSHYDDRGHACKGDKTAQIAYDWINAKLSKAGE